MKKMMIGISLALLALTGCRQKDVRDFTVEVPALSPESEGTIRQALAGCVGVDASSIQFDSANHRVMLRYDSMQTAKKNLEFAIAKVGFEANGVKPEDAAFVTNATSSARH